MIIPDNFGHFDHFSSSTLDKTGTFWSEIKKKHSLNENVKFWALKIFSFYGGVVLKTLTKCGINSGHLQEFQSMKWIQEKCSSSGPIFNLYTHLKQILNGNLWNILC
jgi:hypothetical protein